MPFTLIAALSQLFFVHADQVQNYQVYDAQITVDFEDQADDATNRSAILDAFNQLYGLGYDVSSFVFHVIPDSADGRELDVVMTSPQYVCKVSNGVRFGLPRQFEGVVGESRQIRCDLREKNSK